MDANGKKWILPDSIAEYECEGTTDTAITFDGILHNPGEKVAFKAVGKHVSDNALRFYVDISILGPKNTPWGSDTTSGTLVAIDNNSFSLQYSELKVNTDGYIYFEHKDGRGMNYYIRDEAITLSELLNNESLEKNNYWKAEAYIDSKNISIAQNTNGIFIHAGSESDVAVKIPLNFVNATKKGLGLTEPELDLSTANGATEAIDRVKDAIEIVSGYRSYFGATQNRMEHTIANLDNVVENTEAAESRIRDTDMATEMVNSTKLNILEQAITSMLTQANQSPQEVLSLLQ